MLRVDVVAEALAIFHPVDSHPLKIAEQLVKPQVLWRAREASLHRKLATVERGEVILDPAVVHIRPATMLAGAAEIGNACEAPTPGFGARKAALAFLVDEFLAASCLLEVVGGELAVAVCCEQIARGTIHLAYGVGRRNFVAAVEREVGGAADVEFVVGDMVDADGDELLEVGEQMAHRLPWPAEDHVGGPLEA